MPILEPFIETYKGRKFYFLDPNAEDILIEDIAHSLAYCCRFTGHSNRFYSVAEHSILVSYLANDPLGGLLHDASEAYITDIASPIKPYLHNYKELEDKIMMMVAGKFGFDYPLDPDIKDCDATQLKTEAKHLLKSKGIPWAHLYPTKRPHGISPNCWSPEEAEKKFLERFEEVRKEYDTEFSSPSSHRAWHEDVPGGRVYHYIGWPDGLQSSQLDSRLVREEDSCGQSNHCGQDSRDTSLRQEEFEFRPYPAKSAARERL